MATKLGTPKQIAAKMRKLKQEISLLGKAKSAEVKATRAVGRARRSMTTKKSKKTKKRASRRKPARKKKR